MSHINISEASLVFLIDGGQTQSSYSQENGCKVIPLKAADIMLAVQLV